MTWGSVPNSFTLSTWGSSFKGSEFIKHEQFQLEKSPAMLRYFVPKDGGKMIELNLPASETAATAVE